MTTPMPLSRRTEPIGPSAGRADRTTDRHRGTRAHDLISVSMSGEVLVVTPVGSLDGSTVDALDRLLTEIDAPVVVDLAHCSVDDPGILRRLNPRRWSRQRHSVCLVAPHSEWWGGTVELPHRLAVFRQVADAVQAFVLSDAGYGDGWA
jgi:hypothetical protein